MTKAQNLKLTHIARTKLKDQSLKGTKTAGVDGGVLAPERVCHPGWTWPPNLASPRHRSLGVRKTVRSSAHRRLSRAISTLVADRLFHYRSTGRTARSGSFMEMYQGSSPRGRRFSRWACPRQEAIPAKLSPEFAHPPFAQELSAPAIYPDPRGELELRRGNSCVSCHRAWDQIFAFPDHHHRRLRQRPRTGAPCARP